MKSIVFFGGLSCGITKLISNILGESLSFSASYIDDIKAFTTNDSTKEIIMGKYKNTFPVISVSTKQSLLDEVVLFEMHESYKCEGLNATQKEVLQQSDAFFLVVSSCHCSMLEGFDSFYGFMSERKLPINLIVTAMDQLFEEDYELFMKDLEEKVEAIKAKGVVVDRLYYSYICNKKLNGAIQEEWIESHRMREIINRIVCC